MIKRKELYKLYKKDKKTTREIGLKIGVCHVTVLCWLKKYNIITRKNGIKDENFNYKGGLPHCKDCNKELGRYDAIRCAKCSKQGKNHPNWKGGKDRFSCCVDCGKKLSSYKYKRCQKHDIIFRLKSKIRHPRWLGRISKLPYSFDFNKILKLKILKRDNCKCQLCDVSNKKHRTLYKQNLTVHHIDYNKKNCKKDNLITLCFVCNSKVNANRDYWYAYFTYLIKGE
jgi:hypothetical protein